jgi:beta-lactamase regulating signal transducer with metallopeptidase domain
MMHISFSPEIMQRLAGSLLHFFWEGAVVAMFTALSLRFLTHRSAEARYAVTVAGLVLMAVAPIVTFASYSETGRVAEQVILLLAKTTTLAGRVSAGNHTALWIRWIVLVWFTGVVVCLVRLIAAWLISRELVRSATLSAPTAVIVMFDWAKEQLKLRRTVLLLVSVRIGVPSVVGWLRPRVLLPVSAITGLDEDQLRAVFAHELAHIRRHDFLVNTLQRCLESLLFYHPAIWWLSARTRIERERCCDDLAVQICGDPFVYAQALIELERVRRTTEPVLAVAATGGPLTQRIHRILGRETRNRDWESAAVALIFLLVWLIAGLWHSTVLEAKTISTPSKAAQPIATALLQEVPKQHSPMASMLSSIAAIVTAQPIGTAEPYPIQALATTAQQSSATGSIRGTVFRDSTSDPLRNVQITVRAGSLPLQPIDDNSMNFLLNSGLVGFGPAGATGTDARRAVLEQNAAHASSPNAITTTTDVDGHFTVPSLSAGPFIITAILDGYFGHDSIGRYSTVVQKVVKVVEGGTTDVALSLMPGGTISGRVLDSMGEPAIDATVQMLRVSYQKGVQSLQVVASKTTDDRGEYRLYRLMPGTYYVAVIPRPAIVSNVAPGNDRSNSSQETAVRTFFPRVIDITRASLISLRGGDEFGGTDISLQGARSARISGKVGSSFPTSEMIFATPIGRGGALSSPTATLTLVPHDKNVPQDPSSTRNVTISMSLPVDGHFDLSSVPPGIYDLYASLPDIKGYGPQAPPAQAGSPVAFGRTTIDLRGEDRNDVAVLVHHGGDIKGTVTVDGKLSPSVNNVRISLQPDDSSANIPVYQQVGRFQPAIDSNGSFTIPSVPEAHYRFQVTFGPPLPMQTPLTELERALSAAGVPAQSPIPNSAPTEQITAPIASTSYVADIFQSGASVYDNGVSVGSNANDPIQIIVKTDGGSIEGIVRDSKQVPLAGTTVAMVPQIQRRQNPALYRVEMSDSEGRFVIIGIPPGDYKLFAWENATPGAYQNAQFMSQYENRGVAVTVSSNLRSSVDVGLIQ